MPSFHVHVVFLLENINDLFSKYLSTFFDFHKFKFTHFFYKQQFYKQHQAEISMQNSCSTLRLNSCFSKIILFVYAGYQTKLKISKNKCVFFNENWFWWKWVWKWKADLIDTTQIYLGLDMGTNILNVKCAIVRWWLYLLSTT